MDQPMESGASGVLLDLEPRDVLGVEPRQIRLFRDERQQIRLTLLDDRSYLQVRAMSAFPLTTPVTYVGLADGKNRQICIIQDMADLDADSQAIVKELLEVRYFSPRIQSVAMAKDEFGVVRFKADTDRGEREFFVRNLRDVSQDLPDGETLLTDVDGNRFILPDLSALDRDSRIRMLAVM
jgi:hypothetical protein